MFFSVRPELHQSERLYDGPIEYFTAQIQGAGFIS